MTNPSADFQLWQRELAQDVDGTDMNCVCGHGRESHEQYRPGNDCVVCGCMTYRAPQAVSLTITIGWALILAGIIGFWVTVGWVATHISQWLGA
jgi:hypothetical protein